MHRYMKVGLIHFMAYPSVAGGEGPVLETMKRICADDYFDAIEITHIKDRAVRGQATALLAASHMTVAYGSQPQLLAAGLNVNATDEASRVKAVAFLKEHMDEAYEMGAAGFSFLSGRYEEDRKEEAYAALVKSTKELCAYAESKGSMKVTHEVFDFDVDKKSLVGPASLARRYAGDVRAEFDNFGLLVDLSHLPLLRETPEQAILPVREYITHAHMGNCVVKAPGLPAYGDMHPRFGFPNGENDVEELAGFLKTLLGIGFLNVKNPPVVSFEVKPYGAEDPDVVVANAKRTLNLAWSRVGE
jgi:sugar phosphate isomerase/epimerase